MVLKPEPLCAAIAAATARVPAGSPRIALSAQGELLTQARVAALARLPGLVLVAGRYEGIDERVMELAVDQEVSIGDYVLSGGELPALVLIDALARLQPGALGDERSSVEESFDAGLLDWPHYTRPEVFQGRARAGGAELRRSCRDRALALQAGRGAHLAAAAGADRPRAARCGAARVLLEEFLLERATGAQGRTRRKRT